MADKVFLNGQIITVDRQDRVAEAVAMTGNRIVAVGSYTEIEPYITEHTEVIDLKGKSLLPGFIDSHLHITLYGTGKLGVNCKSPQIESLADVFAKLKVKAQQTPKSEWIRAWGFDETTILERRYPTRWELDQISTEHPIFIMRNCAHHSIVNSRALEIAGFDEHTPDPKGGRLDKDENGKLTGFLVETAHMQMFELASFTEAEYRKGLSLASDDYIAAGITSVHDAGGYGPENLRAMQKAVQSGEVKVRIYAIVCAFNKSEDFVRKMIDSGIVTGLGDEKFRIGPAKLFSDGSSTAATMAVRKPYTGRPDDYGILYYSQEELIAILGEAHEIGFQITAHAQGDRAIEMLLTCYETVLSKHPRTDHRHRIEHAGLTMPDLLERMKKLGIITIPNPVFFHEFGDEYIRNIGERIRHMYPIRDFMDQGIIAAGASDSPVTDHNPILGIHVAVNRISKSGQETGTNQCINVKEAIRIYTWNGAYASFEENLKGSIEPGKLADLVVLSDRILDVPSDKIKDLEVEMTILDGVIVYRKGEMQTGF
jgi:predicted amidohydrolase YtcJ